MNSRQLGLVGALLAILFILGFAFLYLQDQVPAGLTPTVQILSIAATPATATITIPTATAAVTAPAAAATPASQLVDAPVHLAWFYKPPSDGNLSILAKRFDTFILTKIDEPTRDQLKAKGVTTPFLQYLRLDAIHDRGSCTAQPYRNQVADRPGDFCDLTRLHPDWFLRDERGNMVSEVTDGAKYVFMDPGSPAWRNFWLDRARQSQEQLGWDGVFIDNVAASRDKFGRLSGNPVAYPDDARFQDEVAGFLDKLAADYFRPRHRPLYANIIDLENPSVWFRYLTYLDGAMEENFAVGWADDYLSIQEWEDQASRIEKTQALGKQVILVSQGDRRDLDRETFAFASYMLVNQGRASFRYADSRSYDQIWLYDNYSLDLGQALSPRYRNGTTWQRDFTRGRVTVDPLHHTASISSY